MGMTNEAKRPTCQVRSKAIEHSRPEDNPEMFLIDGKVIECLAHAMKSEQRGHRVEIILT